MKEGGSATTMGSAMVVADRHGGGRECNNRGLGWPSVARARRYLPPARSEPSDFNPTIENGDRLMRRPQENY
jgi:hypothetical protein